MIVIYKKVSKREIRKDAKESIPKIEKWFSDNPEKAICNVGLWYSRDRVVRRGHVEEDVNKWRDEALAE